MTGAEKVTGRPFASAPARHSFIFVSISAVMLWLFILVMSIPDIIAGIGLLERRPWARILGIILCILGLLHFPLGTIVGVYGLWVLFSPETEALFQGMPPPPRSS